LNCPWLSPYPPSEPQIPNYRLKKCYDTVPALQAREPLTIVESFSCIRLKMWDEEQQEMVAFY
jgi:omega-6 fatty acid desaturase (delta-12 desaturase)